MIVAHASEMQAVFSVRMTYFSQTLIGSPRAMSGCILAETTSFAGGVLGEPAWVPLIGGAGAKRPADQPEHTPSSDGTGYNERKLAAMASVGSPTRRAVKGGDPPLTTPDRGIAPGPRNEAAFL